jgi:hypothetical protein
VPIVIYSLLRLGLFGLCVWLLWWVGLGSWLSVLLAAFLAWALSYVLLAGPRDRAALQIAERMQARAEARAAGHRFSPNVEEDAALEDAIVDAGVLDDASGLTDPGGAVTQSEREPEPEEHSVGELEHAGEAEDLDQQPTSRARDDRDAQQDRRR